MGGGTKSDLWLQVVSDICAVEQKVPAVVLGASYGDAFLAGLGVGCLTRPRTSMTGSSRRARWSRTTSCLRCMIAIIDIYLRLYQQNKDMMHELYDLVQV